VSVQGFERGQVIVRAVVIFSVSIALVGLVAVVYVFNPEGHGFYPRCPLFVLTGWQCAGCGTLRAAHCLLHGDFARAFALNPMLVVFGPLALLLAVRPQGRVNRYVGWGIAVVLVAYSIWRNF